MTGGVPGHDSILSRLVGATAGVAHAVDDTVKCRTLDACRGAGVLIQAVCA